VLTPLEHREISNKVAKDLFSTKVYKSSWSVNLVMLYANLSFR
jgi:hypothetical protein